jgi:predicted ABC-type ATPase
MPNSDPHLWIFAGPNGAGKSTLTACYLRNRLPIVNPDVIAANLAGHSRGSSAVIEAGKVAVRQRAAFLGSRKSFAIETTLSGNSEIRLMRDAVAAGYKVNLVFIGVRSTLISQGRVAHRVRMGLHSVPPEDIVRRFPRSLENLPIAMRLADRTIIVDNTGEGFRLLLIRENGKTRTYGRKLPGWLLQAVPQELR